MLTVEELRILRRHLEVVWRLTFEADESFEMTLRLLTRVSQECMFHVGWVRGFSDATGLSIERLVELAR